MEKALVLSARGGEGDVGIYAGQMYELPGAVQRPRAVFIMRS